MDNIHIRNDPGIFVTTVRMNGAAAKDGRLQKGDKILEVMRNLMEVLVLVGRFGGEGHHEGKARGRNYLQTDPF